MVISYFNTFHFSSLPLSRYISPIRKYLPRPWKLLFLMIFHLHRVVFICVNTRTFPGSRKHLYFCATVFSRLHEQNIIEVFHKVFFSKGTWYAYANCLMEEETSVVSYEVFSSAFSSYWYWECLSELDLHQSFSKWHFLDYISDGSLLLRVSLSWKINYLHRWE